MWPSTMPSTSGRRRAPAAAARRCGARRAAPRCCRRARRSPPRPCGRTTEHAVDQAHRARRERRIRSPLEQRSGPRRVRRVQAVAGELDLEAGRVPAPDLEAIERGQRLVHAEQDGRARPSPTSAADSAATCAAARSRSRAIAQMASLQRISAALVASSSAVVNLAAASLDVEQRLDVGGQPAESVDPGATMAVRRGGIAQQRGQPGHAPELRSTSASRTAARIQAGGEAVESTAPARSTRHRAAPAGHRAWRATRSDRRRTTAMIPHMCCPPFSGDRGPGGRRRDHSRLTAGGVRSAEGRGSTHRGFRERAPPRGPRAARRLRSACSCVDGLDHDPHHRLGAGRSHQHPPVVAQLGARRGDRRRQSLGDVGHRGGHRAR